MKEKFYKLWLLMVLVLLSAGGVNGQIVMTNTTTSYSQNFDALNASSEGSNVAWSNNSTLPGWYTNQTNYRAWNIGTTTEVANRFYSLGSASTSTDRAFGSHMSSTTIRAYGVAFKNSTGQDLTTAFSISFDIEKYLEIGTGSALIMQYSTSSTSVGDTSNSTNWTTVSSYTTEETVNYTVPNILAGATIYIRWFPAYTSKSNYTIWGIDNFTASWEKNPSSAYDITAIANNDAYGSVSIINSKITAIPAAGYGYANPAYSVNPSNAATVIQEDNEFIVTPTADCSVTINFVELEKQTVYFNGGSGEPEVASLTELLGGAGVTLPTATPCAYGWEFAGWSESEVHSTTTEPEFVELTEGKYYPTSDITLYAVYKEIVNREPSDLILFQETFNNSTVGNLAYDLGWTLASGRKDPTCSVSGIATFNNSTIYIENVNFNYLGMKLYLKYKWNSGDEGSGSIKINNITSNSNTGSILSLKDAEAKDWLIIDEDMAIPSTTPASAQIAIRVDGSGNADIDELKIYVPDGVDNSTTTYSSNPTCTADALIWTGNANTTDWNTPANWDGVNTIPSTVADVTIPGGKTYYPILEDETTVKTITFAPGAELGRQDLLTIDKAIIEYNLAAGTWHMLASPIGKDDASVRSFYLGGTPRVWFKRFTPVGQSEDWTYINDLKTPLAAGDGFAYWIEAGKSGEFSIETTKLAESPVSETIDFGADLGSYFALAGNPFMTSINFNLLADKNSGITSNYLVWESANKGFIGYTKLGGWGVQVNTTADQFIAPLQAFFVERDGTGDNVTLSFNLTDISANATGQGSLKATKNAVPKLDIVADNGTTSVLTFIANSDNAESARKLKSTANNTPDIYTLADNNTTALGAQIINSNQVTVPLGISTSYTGEIALTFSGMDTFDDTNIKLIDTADDSEIILTGEAQTFTFMHTPKQVDGVIQPTENRFFIAFSPASVTGMDEINEQGISIYYKENAICAVSTANDLIEQISVYDVQGRLLYTNNNISAPVYVANVQGNTGDIFVVKVVTENNTKNEKVFVNNK